MNTSAATDKALLRLIKKARRAFPYDTAAQMEVVAKEKRGAASMYFISHAAVRDLLKAADCAEILLNTKNAGFVARLSPQQKDAALSYRGPDHHGLAKDT